MSKGSSPLEPREGDPILRHLPKCLCGRPLLFSARSAGRTQCGPCHRRANGEETVADIARAKDAWIQKAKALLFDFYVSGLVDYECLLGEARELIEAGGGYHSAVESSKTPLRWIDQRPGKMGELHATLDDDGSISIERWHGKRKVTLHITDYGDVEFIRVWGANIHHDMSDGTLCTPGSTLSDLWEWLEDDQGDKEEQGGGE